MTSTEHPSDDHPLHDRANRATDSVAWDLDGEFRQRLCSLVDREMNEIYRRRVEPEEIVQSVFASYYRRMDNGEYRFDDTGHLWYMLKKIATNKLRKRIEYEKADKRDVRRDVTMEDVSSDLPELAELKLFESAVTSSLNQVGSPAREILEFQLLGYDVADTIAHVLSGLDSPHVEVLRLRLQGQKQDAIAEKLGCGRTVVRNCLRRLQERVNRMRDDLFD